jgi:hypothetical protein
LVFGSLVVGTGVVVSFGSTETGAEADGLVFGSLAGGTDGGPRSVRGVGVLSAGVPFGSTTETDDAVGSVFWGSLVTLGGAGGTAEGGGGSDGIGLSCVAPPTSASPFFSNFSSDGPGSSFFTRTGEPAFPPKRAGRASAEAAGAIAAGVLSGAGAGALPGAGKLTDTSEPATVGVGAGVTSVGGGGGASGPAFKTGLAFAIGGTTCGEEAPVSSTFTSAPCGEAGGSPNLNGGAGGGELLGAFIIPPVGVISGLRPSPSTGAGAGAGGLLLLFPFWLTAPVTVSESGFGGGGFSGLFGLVGGGCFSRGLLEPAGTLMRGCGATVVAVSPLSSPPVGPRSLSASTTPTRHRNEHDTTRPALFSRVIGLASSPCPD